MFTVVIHVELYVSTLRNEEKMKDLNSVVELESLCVSRCFLSRIAERGCLLLGE